MSFCELKCRIEFLLYTGSERIMTCNMDILLSLLTPATLALALFVTFFAGVVKGMVGFAMPMIMISGLSSFLSPELALAALILPTLATNGVQALRQGPAQAIASVRKFWVFLSIGFVFLVGSAQLVTMLPQNVLFLLIGAPITLFVLMQLFGWKAQLPGQSARVEVITGAFAGFVGGLSGVWGPPTVAYLTAINTPKQEQIRVQGVIYGLGAVALLAAHLKSGVIRLDTLPFSVLMMVPALGGMMIGFRLQDRIDQATFKRATLFVLLIAGLNLMRRGLLG